MTAVGCAFGEPDRSAGNRGLLWLGAAGLAVAAHAGVLAGLRQNPSAPPESAAPPAITIDLAPMPAAAQARGNRVAADAIDAPDAAAEAPDPIPVPVPPPPSETAPEPATASPPAAATAPEAERTVDPAAAVAAPRPMRRPEALRAAKALPVREEEPDAQPAHASRAAARAEAASPAAARVAAARSAAGNSGTSPAIWQARLLAHLERFKRYPPGARRQRAEGVARVRFSVDERGNVGSAQLVRSSGHAALDAAVLDLVRRASPVPAPPPGAPRDIVAPVQFDVR